MIPSEPTRLHRWSLLLLVPSPGRLRNLVTSFLPILLVVGVWGVLGLALVLAGRHVVEWWRTTYWLVDGVVYRRSGTFVRHEQVLAFERIQQVSLRQGVVQRVLGTAAVEIEAAGSESDIELFVVSHAEAQAWRDAFRNRAESGSGAGLPGGVPADAVEDTDRVLVALDNWRLAVAGLTGVQTLASVAVAFTLLSLIEDALGEDAIDVSIGLATEAQSSQPLTIVVLVLLGLVIWVAVTVTSSILLNGRFTLSLRQDELHVSRGLLDRKEAVLPLARVRSVRVEASPLRRAMAMARVDIRSSAKGEAKGASQVIVPLMRYGEIASLVAAVLPGADLDQPLVLAPARARAVVVVRHVLPVLFVAAVVTMVWWPWGLVALVAVVPAAGLGVAAHAALGHAWADGVMMSRRGALNRRLTVGSVPAVQSTHVRSTVFQRRRNLASFSANLPGRSGSVSARYLDEDHAEALLGEFTR